MTRLVAISETERVHFRDKIVNFSASSRTQLFPPQT